MFYVLFTQPKSFQDFKLVNTNWSLAQALLANILSVGYSTKIPLQTAIYYDAFYWSTLFPLSISLTYRKVKEKRKQTIWGYRKNTSTRIQVRNTEISVWPIRWTNPTDNGKCNNQFVLKQVYYLHIIFTTLKHFQHVTYDSIH